MARHGRIDPKVTDEDAEAIADRALGLTPEMASVVQMDAEDVARRARTRRVGARLNARQFLSDRRKKRFLLALAETGLVSRAATAAGWTADTAYSLRKADPDFAARWSAALEFAVDSLEEEARRRALEGTLKPVFQGGSLVGHVREYSDNLMNTLLKANRPEKYRDNHRLEVDAKGGVLVVPGVAPSAQAWEQAASANQAEHRGNQGEDPLA